MRRCFGARRLNYSRIPDEKVMREGSIIVDSKGRRRPKMTASIKRAEVKKWTDEFELQNQEAKNSGFKNDWAYKASLILLRMPICTKEMSEWEKKYEEWKDAWDAPLLAQIPDPIPLIEDSENPLAPREPSLADREITPDLSEGEKFAILRAKEIDRIQKELSKPGPRITKADLAYDTKSLMRKIDDHLVLVVKRSRPDHNWQLPQVPLPLDYRGGVDPLRVVITKAMRGQVGEGLDFYVPGNCPSGCYAYRYPKEYQEAKDTYGSKVFFYRGYYCEGEVSPSKDYVDYAWLNIEELGEKLQDEMMYRYLLDMIRVYRM